MSSSDFERKQELTERARAAALTKDTDHVQRSFSKYTNKDFHHQRTHPEGKKKKERGGQAPEKRTQNKHALQTSAFAWL